MGVLCLLVGCAGGSSNAGHVEFMPEDEWTFDNAVDLIDKPAIVESEWQGQFERRVTRADFIGVVRVDSISVDEDREGAGYRLTAKVIDTWEGRAPRELVLRVHDDEPGFRTVSLYENRLLGSRFVAFVKWQPDPDSNEEIPRWHLSPDSPGVRDKVRFFSTPPPNDARTEVEVVAP